MGQIKIRGKLYETPLPSNFYANLKGRDKGLMRRDVKLAKKTARRNTVYSDQKDLCRFARIRNMRTSFTHGKRRRPVEEYLLGLQIENKFYYIDKRDNKMHYVMMNKPGVRVVKIYNLEDRDWHRELVEKYLSFMKRAK